MYIHNYIHYVSKVSNCPHAWTVGKFFFCFLFFGDGRYMYMYIYMNKYVPFSVAVETVVAGEMTQSSSHESQSAETHNERRHVTHTHTVSNW